jgi:hypothetical protein
LLAVEDELVPVEAKVAGDFLAEKYEREDVSELQSVISTPISDSLSLVLPQHQFIVTFARFSVKNLYGFVPYETAFPTTGNQWKTAGGSLLLRGRSCRRRLPTTATTVTSASH